MYWYERQFWFFPPVLSTAQVSDCAIELTKAGSRSGTKTSKLERILDIDVRSVYRRIYYQLNTTSISDRLQCYVDNMASITTLSPPREPKLSFFLSDSYASWWIRQEVDPNYDAYRRQKWSIKSCICHKCVCVSGVRCRIVALKS